ncbi:MAG: AmmeMemoRadiSam system radical SAM enzyme [Desulfobacteraceae bacterium]|nr:AmmeMemoRadiSam system radical SAM enzyme [Desulfobacteraceae bacterium]
MDSMSWSRRRFIGCTAVMLCSAGSSMALWPFSTPGGPSDIHGRIFKGDAPKTLWKWSHEAYAYRKLSKDRVVCGICPNRCLLSPGDRSVCRSKVNVAGKLYSLTYGNPCAVHVDPIEKKPLFHFLPASRTFSIAAAGCNFRCLNCQNWEISQAKPHEVRHSELFPDQAVEQALNAGVRSIAYTYSEPVTFFEYMMSTASAAKAGGLKNLWISNGYINQKPLLDLCKVLDAANVNLKSYSDKLYMKLNGGQLQPVLNTFKTLHDQGIHFEMTTLMVTGYVDDPDMFKRMCEWILTATGPDHPLHLLRFFPRYKLERLPPTPVSVLTRFREIAMAEGIRYVYVGNVPGHDGNNTYCHQCHRLLVERRGYHIPTFNISGQHCKFCGTQIPGVWNDHSGGQIQNPNTAGREMVTG